MEADDLKRLIESARSGSKEALGRLLESALPALRTFVRLRMGPLGARESSSDVVQSVCRELLAALPEFEFVGPNEFRNWLFKAAVHKLAAHTRRALSGKRDVRREECAVDAELGLACQRISGTTPSGAAIRKEEIERMLAAFDRLSDEQREIITDARLLGRSLAEIGAHLGKSEDAVRKALMRGLARLGNLLSSRD